MPILTKLRSKLPGWARLASVPARMIDRSFLSTGTGVFNRFWNFVKERVIATFLFLPLVLLDLMASGLTVAYYTIGAVFTTDDRQQYNLSQLAKFANIFSMSFYAILAFPIMLVNPRLVIFYFLPERSKAKGVFAGGDLYRDKEAVVATPDTIEGLQDILKTAKENGHKVMPVGAGFSQGKQFLPEGGDGALVLDMSKFNTIAIDPKDKTVTVGAGATWAEIQLQANKFKLALQVMQASNVFSVGGSIGTNIHGWDHKNGSLSNVIESMDVLTADGELKTLRSNDPLFHQITGGLGLFGIVVSVTLKLTDDVMLVEKGTEVSIQDYPSYFREKVLPAEQTKMHLYRLSLDPDNLLSTGVAVDYKTQDDAHPVRAENLTQEGKRGTRTDRVLINLARRVKWVRKFYWETEKARLLGNNSAPLTTNEVMKPSINAMFNPALSESEWLQEFFLPDDQLADFLKELGALLMENKVCLLNASVRFVKQHADSPLSYAQAGDRFAVVLCFNQMLSEHEVIKAKKWLRQAQHLAVTKGGTYYLPYQHVSSPEDFAASYPRANEAFEAKKKVDPDALFTSGFYQKYFNTAPKPNYFKEIMATDATKKEFSGFLDGVLQRVDKEAFFALLEDVMAYNDTHEEIYTELCRRLPEVMPGTINSLRRILGSLSDIKKDLGAQARSLLPADLTEINGLVEIGYPGRFVQEFRDHYKVSGNVVAAYEAQALTDYVQTGFPRPYNQFLKLDYNKPNLTELPENSADVITCFVGLHHFPEAELDAFLKEVRRVLRPNGHFILVDHDVVDSKSTAMAHMAHTIFNAVNGVSTEEELNELRNFQPISYWQERLAKHELGYESNGPDVPMIRAGDPSKNRMVSFKNTKEIELASTVNPALSKLGTNTNSNSDVLHEPNPSGTAGAFFDTNNSSTINAENSTSMTRDQSDINPRS